MQNELPLVTAVVTTHNRLSLLPRALDSVAGQTYPNIEIIVVDDGSDEEVSAVVDAYRAGHSVQLLRNAVPQGACRARNQGIQAARGTFVAGLDDDDQWHPQRIEKMLKKYSEKYAFVTSDIKMMYQKGTPTWQKKAIITLGDLLYSNYVGNQGLIKKEYLSAVGGFDETLEAAQDYDLWIRLTEKFGPVLNIQEPLQKVFLEHGGQRISNPRDQLRGYLAFYQKHKGKMNYSQRKYQLFTIRKATGKVQGPADFCGWVPPHRYWKELKGWILKTYMAG